MKMPISDIRKRYIARLIARIVIFVVCVLAYLFDWIRFDILEGSRFFRRVSVLHALWTVWVIDMIFQLAE